MGIEQSRYIQHLRSEIMNSKEEAIIKLQDMMSALNMERADGVQLISRYRNNDKIISLVGIVAVDDNNNSDITIVNAEDAYVTKNEFETAINELKKQINNNSGSTDNTEEKDEFGSGYDIDNDYWIHCEYDITNVADETKLLGDVVDDRFRKACDTYIYTLSSNNETKILAMKIDGVDTDVVLNYKFNTFGKHYVDFLLKDTTILHDCMFYGVKNLTKIIIPFSIEEIGYYSLGECIKLEYVQFNEINLPKLHSNAFYYVNNENGILKIHSTIDESKILGEKTFCDISRLYFYKLPITWTVEYIDEVQKLDNEKTILSQY